MEIILALYISLSLMGGCLMGIDRIVKGTSPCRILEFNTIGDIVLIILLFGAWVISVIIYLIFKLFINRYTIAFMNIKLKK